MYYKNPDEMIGKRKGHVIVLGLDCIKNNRSYWICLCDCGKTISKRSDALLRPNCSCGCVKNDNQRKRMTEHGETKTRLYSIWLGMKSRCYCPSNKCYNAYGQRGITVFPQWKDDFVAFKDYVSALPHYGEDGYTLDRIDPNGNYEPNNLRWATAKEQGNNRRDNHFLTMDGVTLTVSQWAEKLGIKYSTLTNRLASGYSDIDALTKPVKSRKDVTK